MPKATISILILGFSFLLLVSSGFAQDRVDRPAERLVELVDQTPASIQRLDSRPGQSDGALQIDFGRVAYGNLELTPPKGSDVRVIVHLGEKIRDGRIDRQPPGTVRYHRIEVNLADGKQIVAPPANARNTQQTNAGAQPAVLTPEAWGVVTPFRWVEIEGWPSDHKPELIRRAAFIKDWDDDAATFVSSDEMLNKVWELCKYSIKATTVCGVYIDGDRERIAYEGDAYINQLCHYYTDDDKQMARETYDWLQKHPTWPTEWTQHMVLIAHADWLHTGDTEWLAPRYEALKEDLLLDRTNSEGLLLDQEKMVLDWPQSERDGYVFKPINTVLNAFYLTSLDRIAQLAEALDKPDEAAAFRAKYEQAYVAFQDQLFDEATGIYVDGVGTDHSAIHANLFPLAFGLVPEEKIAGVVDWLRGKGMDCSVYAAQHLMNALFAHGGDEKAIALILAPGDRSWRHMVESGTTITWEAWDQKYKPNQDWNHAWGAAPANLLPRYVLGVEPLEAGWKRARISPKPGGLTYAKGKVPTPQGPVRIDWKNDGEFRLELELPEALPAQVSVPAAEGTTQVLVNGSPVAAQRVGNRWLLAADVAGAATIEVK